CRFVMRWSTSSAIWSTSSAKNSWFTVTVRPSFVPPASVKSSESGASLTAVSRGSVASRSPKYSDPGPARRLSLVTVELGPAIVVYLPSVAFRIRTLLRGRIEDDVAENACVQRRTLHREADTSGLREDVRGGRGTGRGVAAEQDDARGRDRRVGDGDLRGAIEGQRAGLLVRAPLEPQGAVDVGGVGSRGVAQLDAFLHREDVVVRHCSVSLLDVPCERNRDSTTCRPSRTPPVRSLLHPMESNVVQKTSNWTEPSLSRNRLEVKAARASWCCRTYLHGCTPPVRTPIPMEESYCWGSPHSSRSA